MNAIKSMDVACLNQYRYEKYYGKQQVTRDDAYNALVEEKKQAVRKSMIKGYLSLLSNQK